MLGLALLYQGALSSFAIVLIFLLITDRWYIRYEEQEMRRVFGEAYEDYCRRTRRWL